MNIVILHSPTPISVMRTAVPDSPSPSPTPSVKEVATETRHPVRAARNDSLSAGSSTLPAPSATPSLTEERSAAGTLVAIGYQTYVYERFQEAARIGEENAHITPPTFDNTSVQHTSRRVELPPRQIYYSEQNNGVPGHHDRRRGVSTPNDGDYGASAPHDRSDSRARSPSAGDRENRFRFPDLSPLPPTLSGNRYPSPPPRDPFLARESTYGEGRQSAPLAPLAPLPRLGPLPFFAPLQQSRHNHEYWHNYQRHKDQWLEQRRYWPAPYPTPSYSPHRGAERHDNHSAGHRLGRLHDHPPPLQYWPRLGEYHAPIPHVQPALMAPPPLQPPQNIQPAQSVHPAVQLTQQQLENIHPALLPNNMRAAAPSKHGRSWNIPTTSAPDKAPTRGKGATRLKTPTRTNPPRGKGKQKVTPGPEPEQSTRSPSIIEIPDSPEIVAVEAPKQIMGFEGNAEVEKARDEGVDGQKTEGAIAVGSSRDMKDRKTSEVNGAEQEAVVNGPAEGENDGRASISASITDDTASLAPQSMW